MLDADPRSYIAPVAREALVKDPLRLKVAAAFRKFFRTSHYEHSLDRSTNWYVLLRPTPEMREAFGLEREVLCLVSDYHELEVRTLESANAIVDSYGRRLEQDVFFIVSNAPNAARLTDSFSKEHGRRIVLAPWSDIEAAHEEYPRELLREFFYSRDLFHQTTAVSVDGQFFARGSMVSEILDNLRHGQNCGVFGLRKIGKTSVLERVRKQNAIARHLSVAYVDAQLPEVYTLDAAGVAFQIVRQFNSSWAEEHGRGPLVKDLKAPSSIADASRTVSAFMSRLVNESNKPALLIIDELERILPSTTSHTHWRTEYLHLWRMLRAIHQSLAGRFVFLVASTNPFFAETAEFDDEDNPLYRFVKPYYLNFFRKDELSDMLTRLGRPMGIDFEDSCLDIICREYGGHPFLSRQLCSHLRQQEKARPLHVTPRMVANAKQASLGQVQSDLRGILKVFKDFYPAEFEVLQLFAADKTAGRQALHRQPLLADHLVGYGLIERDASLQYTFAMRALEEYLTTDDMVRPKPPEVPAEVLKRHSDIQARVNEIELALRGLIVAKLRDAHGAAWQREIMNALSENDVARIEARGTLTPAAFMEELMFPQLLQIVSGSHAQFKTTFPSKSELRANMAGAETARRLSDHRKLTDCGNDALYLKAISATEYFYETLALR